MLPLYGSIFIFSVAENWIVVCHPLGTQRSSLTQLKTLPTLPHAIFSSLQGTQSQPCKELKMPTHSPPITTANPLIKRLCRQ